MEKRDVPEIRFEGFTDDWERHKLDDIVQITMGQSPDGSTYSDKPSDYILVQGNADLKNGWVEPRVWTTQVTKKAEVGDLIMSVRAPAGTMGKTAYNVVIGRGVAAIKGNEFIYQLLVKMDSNEYWKTLSCGSTFESLNSDNIKNTNVIIPKKDEQETIGLFFNNLDNLITFYQHKYEKLKLFKEAMLDKMFPKNGEKVPEIRLKGFTDDWERCKLSKIVEVCSGRDYKHLSEGNIPVYGTGGYMLSVNKALSYDRDAVGIGRKGTIDKPYILRAPFWTVDTLFYALPRDYESIDFTFDIFQTIDWRKKDESTGVPSLSKETINEIEIIIPSSEEQKKIGAYFKQLDNLIILHQHKYEKLKLFKEAMLNKMFI